MSGLAQGRVEIIDDHCRRLDAVLRVAALLLLNGTESVLHVQWPELQGFTP